jgi:hypothetical protein
MIEDMKKRESHTGEIDEKVNIRIACGSAKSHAKNDTFKKSKPFFIIQPKNGVPRTPKLKRNVHQNEYFP